MVLRTVRACGDTFLASLITLEDGLAEFVAISLGHISGTVDCPAVSEEVAPCPFCDAAQFAIGEFAPAQLV
jgi:hypothetical protein